MLLDEYLNYLQEVEEEVEEKFAIARRLKLLIADPLKKKKHAAAIKKHIKARQQLKPPKQYKEKVKQIKVATKKGTSERKAKLKALAGRKEFKSVRLKAKASRKSEKSMKRRRRIRTTTALAGAGSGGFYTAKRADTKGQSL